MRRRKRVLLLLLLILMLALSRAGCIASMLSEVTKTVGT